MKTIIAGSRGIVDFEIIKCAIRKSGFKISTVLSGTARGVDRFGERWAEENGIPVVRYPANWNDFKKAAGYIRNEEMACDGEALIAIWDGKSKGTRHMIDLAALNGLRIWVELI